jgi:hypothetical protein
MRRRDFVSKRRLTSPSQILNASKDGGGSFDRCCSLQNNWFVMVRNNELLYSPVIDDVPTIKVPRALVTETKPAVIQSFVLDCETCERLSRYGVFFALTCEFSVLAGVKFGAETFTFNEIVDSFYDEVEIDQALLDSPTTMFMPNYPDLLVITTLRKIVLISIDIDAIIDDVEQVEVPSVHSSYSDQEQVVDKEISRSCVRGVRVIETNADNYIFMDDVRLYHPSISEHIESIHTPVILECSMWSSQVAQTGGADINTTTAQMHYTLVFTGDANWIRFMPVVQGDVDGVWEDLDIQGREGNLFQVSPSTWITDHEVWITAVSKAADTASLYATGDQIGTLSFWRAKTNTKEGYSTYEPHFKVRDAASVQGGSVVSLTQAPHDLVTDGLFVGDSSGAITCIKVDARNRVIETLWKTRLFTPDSGPTVSRWQYHSSSSSANNDNDNGGGDDSSMVMVYSSALGIAYEYVVQKQVVSSFNAAYGNDATRQNKCAVEVCAVLIELDALVTASSLNSASIWRLSNGELITTVELPEYFVTSVAAYDTGYVFRYSIVLLPFFSCCDVSVCLSVPLPSIAACSHSLTPNGTSLTIVSLSPSTNQSSIDNKYSHMLITYLPTCTGTSWKAWAASSSGSRAGTHTTTSCKRWTRRHRRSPTSCPGAAPPRAALVPTTTRALVLPEEGLLGAIMVAVVVVVEGRGATALLTRMKRAGAAVTIFP